VLQQEFSHEHDHIQRLVETLGRRHGCLDGQATDVLPSLLQQRDEIVDGKHDISDQLVLSHSNVSDGYTHAENLLQLELDGGLDFGELDAEVIGVRHGGWEFPGLGETWTQETRNLLDQGFGGEERVVLPGELLDQLLVLVELLQVLSGHGVDSKMLGTIDIELVTKNADAHIWAGHIRKLDSARETLVTLRVIVLETNLKLDGLEKVSLLGLGGVFEELLDV